MTDEEKVLVLKRTIRCLTRAPNQMTDQLKEDLEVLEEMITELGGDTRNDLRALPHDIGTDNARQSEFMHKHQDEPNFDGPEEGDE